MFNVLKKASHRFEIAKGISGRIQFSWTYLSSLVALIWRGRCRRKFFPAQGIDGRESHKSWYQETAHKTRSCLACSLCLWIKSVYLSHWLPVQLWRTLPGLIQLIIDYIRVRVQPQKLLGSCLFGSGLLLRVDAQLLYVASKTHSQ